MVSIIGILLGAKKLAVSFFDALPAALKWILLAFIALLVSNGITYCSATKKAEKRVTDKYEQKLSGMRRLNTIAVVQQEREMAELRKELQGKRKELDEARERYNTLKKEVPKYVTKKADSMCTITTGFERLYDASTTGAKLEVSGSGGLDVDAPSGIAISHVAAVTVENNAECVERGKVIDAWQLWYYKSKDTFRRAQEIANGNQPSTTE